MKLSTAASSLFGLAITASSIVNFVTADCVQPSLSSSTTIGLKVTKVAQIPVLDANTAPFNYNMDAADNFDGDTIYFLDQNNGVIYSYTDGASDVTPVFDVNADAIPAGLTLDYEYGPAPETYRIKAMTLGTASNTVIVVFGSSTLPEDLTEAHAKLPAHGAHFKYVCDDDNLVRIDDIYRVGTIPDCAATGGGPTFTIYDSFYEYTVEDDGSLSNPALFFVAENQLLPGQLGSGILTLPSGDILWATGDNTFYGLDGGLAPQLDNESVGKILKIDTSQVGVYTVAAKGVRNSQKMWGFTQDGQDYISFMDIGGVTSEVNAFPLSDLEADLSLNFGWGRNLHDGKAREGTYYVGHGQGLILEAQPPCESDAPQEDGFVQPWVQFGRSNYDVYFEGISGMAIPPTGGSLTLVWSEVNTGTLLGTTAPFVQGMTPADAFKLYLFDENDQEIRGGEVENVFPDIYRMNALVAAELGLNPGENTRGDPRMFHFPNGDMGVLIERTGGIYKIEEKDLSVYPPA